VYVYFRPCALRGNGSGGGITQGSFKVETPQTRTLARPSNNRRQRMLAIITATLGLLLGGLVGAAFAEPDSSSTGEALAESPASPVAAAATAPDSGAQPWEQNVEADAESGQLALMPQIIKVGFGLALVVTLAWGTVYLLRRTTLGQGMAGSNSSVQVVDRNWLGPKKAIYLVDISGRTLALGVTEEHISVLSSWEAGEIEIARPTPQPGSFANQFKGMLQRNRGVSETVEGVR
jgi:flagellar biogenesis protein FliO